MHHFKLKTARTAHYYISGALSEETTHRWMVLHGYGQTAERLLRKFDILEGSAHYLVAPEGHARFYWEGVRGNVVASWMTSKDRLDEIADYVDYLDKVSDVTHFASANSHSVLLGFSQGCATAWRWLLNSRPPIRTYIMWSGWLPEDMNYRMHRDYLSQLKLIYVHGEADPFYDGGRFAVLLRRFDEAGLAPAIVRHPGGHSIDRAVLKELMAAYL